MSASIADAMPVSTDEMASGCLMHQLPKSLIGVKSLSRSPAVLLTILPAVGRFSDTDVIKFATQLDCLSLVLIMLIRLVPVCTTLRIGVTA